MIYFTLFCSFFLIGLLAVGGGAATIPFLFDLSTKYNWFDLHDLTNMIAVSESTPGPIGINMATFAGYKAASYLGGIVATFGLVLPSFIIIILISKILKSETRNRSLSQLLKSVQPAVIALILNAAFQIGCISLNSTLSCVVFIFLLILMRLYKASPIFYIILSGIIGYGLNL